jgi:hypothetical protein
MVADAAAVTKRGERITLALDVDVASAPNFEVTMIRAGDALNGWRFPGQVLEESAFLWQGASCFVDHAWWPSVRDLVGVISEVEYAGEALRGRLRLSATPTAQWVKAMVEQIIEDKEKGLSVPNVGLSAGLYAGYYLEGSTKVATEIGQVYSVDVVFYPAAGGSFDRVLNSVKGGLPMPPRDNVREGERVVVSPAPPGSASDGTATSAAEPVFSSRSAPADVATAQAQATAEEAQRLLLSQCQAMLESRLMWCELPKPMTDAIRVQFEGRVFKADELDFEVERYRNLLAGMLEGGVVRGMGEPVDHAGGVVSGMMTSLDRMQLAFDRLMGLPIPEAHSDIPRLSGLREFYIMMTGDYDFYGRMFPERARFANVTTSSVTSIVKNALNKRLLAAYNVRPKWWDRICYHEEFGSLNQVTWMKSGGFGTLPTVSEGAAYTELDWSDAEETADFVKKGGYIGLTLEMIDRDDVGAVRRIPTELGNAAWRTLSALVSAIFTDNSGTGPVMSCAHNVFDASNHGNLLTTALSTAQWDTVIQAVFQQTEPTSGAVLAIRPKFLLVPIELERTALTILGQPWADADNKHYLEPRYASGEVVVVPEWTDANDWAAVCDPLDCPGICIGYRYGREPELFVADDNVVGSMFTNDEMRIKVRFFVAVGVADYRPLHKSNVS